ncbi:MAG TPA: hypothetical protein VEA60_12625 [Allosphingosinicella sp.]|nr:hypothetical protein [Allosphingosinicella sp.]
MPYGRAHWYLLALFPLTGFAFWPAYFSKLASAPFAFHLHGATASLWIALLAFQSWSIHRRRNALHRAAGYASFPLFALFVAGGLMVIRTMAVKFGLGTDPFYAAFGARLAAVDAVSSLALPWFFHGALKHRRRVQLHARYMLAPILFLLPPILSRLMPILPPLAIAGPADFPHFGYGLHLANAVAVAAAAWLWLRAPKHGRPFAVAGALIGAQSLLFETLGGTSAWESVVAAVAAVPALTVLGAGLGIAAGAIWLGWTAGRPPRPAAIAA